MELVEHFAVAWPTRSARWSAHPSLATGCLTREATGWTLRVKLRSCAILVKAVMHSSPTLIASSPTRQLTQTSLTSSSRLFPPLPCSVHTLQSYIWAQWFIDLFILIIVWVNSYRTLARPVHLQLSVLILIRVSARIPSLRLVFVIMRDDKLCSLGRFVTWERLFIFSVFKISPCLS